TQRELEDHRRPGVLVLDGERRSERSRPFGEHLEGAPPSLARRVVANDEMERFGVGRGADLEAGGRATPDRLLERLARDLVQRRLLALPERIDGADIEGEVHRVFARTGLAKRVERRGEPVVTQQD